MDDKTADDARISEYIENKVKELRLHFLLFGELPPRILEGEEKEQVCRAIGGGHLNPDAVVVRAMSSGGFDIMPAKTYECLEAEKARKQEWYKDMPEDIKERGKFPPYPGPIKKEKP